MDDDFWIDRCVMLFGYEGMNKSRGGVLTAGQSCGGGPSRAGRARGHTASITVPGAWVLGPLRVATMGLPQGYPCGETEARQGSALQPQTQDPNSGLLRL